MKGLKGFLFVATALCMMLSLSACGEVPLESTSLTETGTSVSETVPHTSEIIPETSSEAPVFTEPREFTVDSDVYGFLFSPAAVKHTETAEIWMGKLISVSEEHNITLRFSRLSHDARMTDFASGKSADLLCVSGDLWRIYAANGYLAELEPAGLGVEAESLELYATEGVPYVVPTQVTGEFGKLHALKCLAYDRAATVSAFGMDPKELFLSGDWTPEAFEDLTKADASAVIASVGDVLNGKVSATAILPLPGENGVRQVELLGNGYAVPVFGDSELSVAVLQSFVRELSDNTEVYALADRVLGEEAEFVKEYILSPELITEYVLP